MRPLWGLAAALIYAWIGRLPRPARAADPNMLGQYRARRIELRKSLDDGVTVLFGRREEDEDLRTGFFQESNFFYLTGWREPGAILLLAPVPDDSHAPGYAARAKLPREILFLPERNPDREKWTGRKIGPGDENVRGEITGFETVMPAERFETELHDVLQAYARIYTLTDQPAMARLKLLEPLREISNAAPAIAKLRMSKSPEEIAMIQRATDVTLEGHRAAWERAAPGLYEYQVAATMTGIFAEVRLRTERLLSDRRLGPEFRLPALLAQLAAHGRGRSVVNGRGRRMRGLRFRCHPHHSRGRQVHIAAKGNL